MPPSGYLYILWPQFALRVAGQHDGDDFQHRVVQLVLQQLHQVLLDLLACTHNKLMVMTDVLKKAKHILKDGEMGKTSRFISV